jgi:hypothetical protein
MSNSLAQRLGWVLWPSFLMACVAELTFFALFDPTDLHLFGVPIEADRMPIYTIGFFAQSPFEVNRCTLEPNERPLGCPKRCHDETAAHAERA